MLERTTNRWRVLGAVVVALTSLAWPSIVSAHEPWRATLVHQDPVVSLRGSTHGRATIALRTGGTNGDRVAAELSIYPKITTRSALAPVLDGSGVAGLPISVTGSFPLNCRTNGVANFELTVGERSGTASTTCGGAQPYLSLNCSGGNCDGVYPLAITANNGSQSSTIWSLLSVTTSSVEHPIDVAWIFSSNPYGTRATRHETGVLRALGTLDSETFTIGTDYQGLGHVIFAQTPPDEVYREALVTALRSPRHALAPHPPASVDYASLAGAKLSGDIVSQLHFTTDVVAFLATKTALRVATTNGAVSPGDLSALRSVGVRDVVIPDAALSQAPSSTLTWGTPFHVQGAASGIIAVATDSGIRELAEGTASSAGLRAALIAGTLALLHFQAPYASAARTCVVDAPLSALAPSFVSDLFWSLRRSPYVRNTNLSDAFDPALIGANGYPTSQRLSTPPAPAWSSANVESAGILGTNLLSFNESISSQATTTPIQSDGLFAERRSTSGTRQFELDSANGHFLNELNHFHIDSTTITLTGAGTSLPITLTSTAPYTATGYLVLSAPRSVHFHGGRVVPITLSASTKSIRVPVEITGNGNFTLVARFVSSNRQMTIAYSAIQVRSTATSAVGYVLSIGSLAVIALWWWRTSRRRSTGRHAS